MKELNDLMSKTLSFGLGLAAMSKEQVEKWVEECVNRGELARQDMPRFVDDLVERGEKAKTELEDMVQRRVQHMIDSMQFVKKEQLAALEQRLLDLEQRIAKQTDD